MEFSQFKKGKVQMINFVKLYTFSREKNNSKKLKNYAEIFKSVVSWVIDENIDFLTFWTNSYSMPFGLDKCFDLWENA